ncbi:carbamoyltransferase HypF [Streptomyces sp. NPDC005438]|uniref:carbamoyltransferase HypF n=1 Tax=Streptomyces sp. NPDC005438 TaxID=3156880 RepID=UPI0033A366D1
MSASPESAVRVAPPAPGPVVRRRLRVRGVVQGVGFRPHVYALATGLGLAGHVANGSSGVSVEVEGPREAVEHFGAQLAERPPPLARVVSVEQGELEPLGERGFTIRPSHEEEGRTLAPADTAVCERCLAEMWDPDDRRHRHPFITCTHCGPRFTLIEDLPYDRSRTTMTGFPLCERCAAEYRDPADRRFHAQPVACHSCGPRLRFTPAGFGARRHVDLDALRAARGMLARGAILAVKGLGGYHLACDAGNPEAVEELRRRKGRGDKPLAVMVDSLDTAARVARLGPYERELLSGPRRPVVLARPGPEAGRLLADRVCAGSPRVGVMLPYTPLHHLLTEPDGGPTVLVMTSGNRSGEPLVTDDTQAVERLADLVDGWLWHDRPIRVPCDDSVVRVRPDGTEALVRRSRGYVPEPLPLPFPAPPLLAVGGDLKNTLCLASGDQAWLSAHVGDLGELATQQGFERARAHLGRLTGVAPERIAHDAHPGYHSTRLARRLGRALVPVQHHHAHLASCMAEHGLDGSRPVLGVAFDGTGYGTDGSVWGGEVLLADYRGFQRLARLAPVPLPGGDAAVRLPYRMALAHLHAAGLPWEEWLPCVRQAEPQELRVLRRQLSGGVGCVPTSSAGRLFDAASALAGVCPRVSYEAQAAVEWEALALRAWDETSPAPSAYPLPLAAAPSARRPASWNLRPLWRAVVDDLRDGVPPALVAARFHRSVAYAVYAGCRTLATRHRVRQVALSGGVFANSLLEETVTDLLRADGLEVLRHQRVPANDGGLALGQAVVAAHHRGPL